MTIGQALVEFRLELGFRSARGFYQFLSERKKLDFNYSYYMRIEKNKVVPSHQVILQLNDLIGKEKGEQLTQIYCSTLFPEMKHLFKRTEYPVVSKKIISSTKTPTSTLVKQKFLSPLQVAQITKSKNHYYLFLVVTLARIPIEKVILENLFTKEVLDGVLSDFAASKIIVMVGNKIHSYSKELKFPPAETDNLKKLYKMLDLWDAEFNTGFNLERLLHKVLIRRVSPRFIELIVNHCSLLLDLARASEETESAHNDEILTLTLSLSKGVLPG